MVLYGLNEFFIVFVQHVPRINGEIPSVDEATSDHQRLLDRYYVYLFSQYCIGAVAEPGKKLGGGRA